MQTTIREDLTRAEMIALPVTLVLLVMVFGSAIAALSLGVGIVAILGTNAVLRGLTEFTDVSVFAMNLTTALGLGLAIDYALFIVRRYREELAEGAAPSPSSPARSSREDVIGAIATTLRTAGRTVLFSSLTVAVYLSAAMLLFPQYFLRSFAYAGIAVVLAAATALSPAPGGAGAARPPGELAGSAPPVPARKAGGERRSGAAWGRMAALVMRRAPVFAVATTVGLIVLGLPFLGVKFGTADDRQLPRRRVPRRPAAHTGRLPGQPGALKMLVEGRATEAQYTASRTGSPRCPRCCGWTGPWRRATRPTSRCCRRVRPSATEPSGWCAN